MSDAVRIAVVGATGLIGRSVIETASGREDVRLTGIARREMQLPRGVRMEMFVADPANWGQVFEAVRPEVLVCALGTTWNKASRDETAFRAVDEQLVIDTARAAKNHGCERLVAVSSTGADATSRNFYLRVKGEVERALTGMKFHRLDILRPGLLRGQRGEDRRMGERLGILAAPLSDRLLRGRMRGMRSIEAAEVAKAALWLATRKAAGRFVHDNDGIHRAANYLPMTAEG